MIRYLLVTIYKSVYSFAGRYGESRRKLSDWFEGRASPLAPPPPPYIRNLKNGLPDIPEDGSDPGRSFWEAFPFHPIPAKPTSVIDADLFEAAIHTVRNRMTTTQRELAVQVISDLRFGADTLVDTSKVPSVIMGNNRMDHEAAINCADQLASSVKDGIICGPFDTPPMADFRSNLLFTVERNGKHRLILDLSSPEGESYNDAIDKDEVPNITMASPREIADKLHEFGSTAYLSKADHKGAFKLVPAKADLVRLQGFEFLGKFFVESQLVFGSRSSPAIYDRLHEVFLLVAQLRSNTSSYYLHRTLDDFVAVTPDRETNQRIVDAYISLAHEINLPLAPLDNPEKAFLVKQQGIILGVELDAKDCRWRLPADKVHRHRRIFEEIGANPHVSGKTVERLLGMTQSVTSMLPALKPLTYPLLKAVQEAKAAHSITVTKTLRACAVRWLLIYHDLLEWRPISHPMIRAPLISPFISVTTIRSSAGLHIGIAIQGAVAGQFIWPDYLTKQVFAKSPSTLAFPQLFLHTVGLLCALWKAGPSIRGSHFTCLIDSPLLTTILRKGRDKRCHRTTTVIEAIFLALVHLDALPSFEAGESSAASASPTWEIPPSVAHWLRKMRPCFPLSKSVVEALASESIISPTN